MSPGEVKLWIAGTVLAAAVAAGLVIGLVFGNVLEATAVKLWTAGMISRPVMLSFRCNPSRPRTVYSHVLLWSTLQDQRVVHHTDGAALGPGMVWAAVVAVSLGVFTMRKDQRRAVRVCVVRQGRY